MSLVFISSLTVFILNSNAAGEPNVGSWSKGMSLILLPKESSGSEEVRDGGCCVAFGSRVVIGVFPFPYAPQCNLSL
jgi:hypothetical protein